MDDPVGIAERREVESRHRLNLLQSLTDPRVLVLSFIYFTSATASYGIAFFLPQVIKQLGETNFMTGVLSGIPTIGCAKSLLTGRHGELPDERGARVPLTHYKEQIGWALRTRPRVKPVFVSPGHRVGMAAAADLVMACVTRYRLPETTRYAHNLASHGTIPI